MKKPLVAAALLFAAVAVHAHEFKLGALSIGHPYARPTAPSQPTGGGYLTFVNKGADDRLLSASTPAAREVQLHTMQMQGDVMRMREVDAVDLPSGQTVELKPGGLHLMLIGLKAPLVVGQAIPLTLKFEKAGEITVELKVDAAPAGGEVRHKAH